MTLNLVNPLHEHANGGKVDRVGKQAHTLLSSSKIIQNNLLNTQFNKNVNLHIGSNGYLWETATVLAPKDDSTAQRRWFYGDVGFRWLINADFCGSGSYKSSLLWPAFFTVSKCVYVCVCVISHPG